MNMKPTINVEIKLAENLKPEIRKEHKLPDKGLVIKKIIRTSPARFEYVAIESGFSSHMKSLAETTNMQDFVVMARNKI